MPTIDRHSTILSPPVSGGGWVPGDAATGHVMRDVAGWVKNLYPQDTPLLSAIKMGKPRRFPKLEWGTGAELFHFANLATGINTTDTVITVDTGEGDRFMVGDVIAMYERDANGVPDDATQQNQRILSIDVDDLTVERNVGALGAQSFSAGAYIHNLGNAVVEAADFNVSPTVFGDFHYNYYQTFQKGHRISFEANVQPDWEHEDVNEHISRLMTDAARRAKRNLNDSLARGARQVGTATAPSTMSGFPAYVPSANKTNLAGMRVSPYDIEAEGAALWETVGDAAAKKLFMSMRTSRLFDGILQKYKEARMDDTSASLVFKDFETRFGQFEIMPTRGWPDSLIVGCNIKNLTIHPYKGMNWQEMEHPVHGAYVQRSVFGRFSLRVDSPETMFAIYGFSTDFANYGRII